MTLMNKRYNGILLGRFPGRYTRPKTGIFSWSQYELSSLQNFVLRHIGGIAPRLSRDCPISRHPLTFTHGEISQKFFRKFFASRPHLTRRIRTVSQESAEPAKTLIMLPPAEIFPKIFFQIFSQNFETLGRLRRKCALTYIARNFCEKFLPKKFGILYKVSTPRQLDREDFVTLQFHYEVSLRSKRI